MDLNFAKTYAVPTICKDFLDLVDTIDGSLLFLGAVTHQTLPVMVITLEDTRKPSNLD